MGKGLGIPGHLEADIETLDHAKPVLNVLQFLLANIHRGNVCDPGRQVKSVLVDIGDNNMAGPDVASNGACHDADRPRARDQDVLAHQVEA